MFYSRFKVLIRLRVQELVFEKKHSVGGLTSKSQEPPFPRELNDPCVSTPLSQHPYEAPKPRRLRFWSSRSSWVAEGFSQGIGFFRRDILKL